jgi:glycosyltransferase involved in cell wall biosynthesis
MQSPHVAIIIRTFNEDKHIKKLLEACFSQKTQYSFEVIVVDSGSTDKTLNIVKNYPVILEHIKSSEFTYGRALNIGARKAKADFCVCISAHCYPSNDNWLEELIRPFENKKIAMVYGRQVGDDRTKFSEEQIFQQYFPKTVSNTQDAVFSNNANSAFRRECWESIEFDENLPGLEDIDWAKKMSDSGMTIFYSPEACVYHIHEETYAQVYKRYYREALGLKTIYPESGFNVVTFISKFIGHSFSDSIKALKNKVLFNNLLSIFCFRYCQFAGTMSAYKNYGKMK